MAQFVVWSHRRQMTRWFDNWHARSVEGKELRRRAAAKHAEAREEAEANGWAPKVGVVLFVLLLAAADVKCNEDAHILRRSYAMAGEHRRILVGPLQQPITDIQARIAE